MCASRRDQTPPRGSPLLAGLAALAILLPAPVAAQASDWSVTLDASVVLNDMGGSLTFDGVSAPADLKLSDLVDRKEGFSADLHVWWKNWGLLAGIDLIELERQSATVVNNVFTRQVDETIGQITLARRLAPGAHVFAGIRTWNTALRFELGPPTPAVLDGSDSWIDPVVGGHLLADLGEGWFMALDADIGGFGASSDLTWSATGSAGYNVSRRFAVVLAFRGLGVDYTTVKGGRTVVYDTVRYGPQLGINLTF